MEKIQTRRSHVPSSVRLVETCMKQIPLTETTFMKDQMIVFTGMSPCKNAGLILTVAKECFKVFCPLPKKTTTQLPSFSSCLVTHLMDFTLLNLRRNQRLVMMAQKSSFNQKMHMSKKLKWILHHLGESTLVRVCV